MTRQHIGILCLALASLCACGRKFDAAGDWTKRRIHFDCSGYSFDATATQDLRNRGPVIFRNDRGQQIFPSEQCTQTVLETIS